MKIPSLTNLKLHFNQILFSNGYQLIEVLISHIISLVHLSISIGYLSDSSVIDGQRMEVNLLSTLSNLMELNFYFRFPYKKQQKNDSFILSFKSDYWLLKRKQNVICYTDSYNLSFYLYSLPFVFSNIDCVSNGIDNYQSNFDNNLNDGTFQFNTDILPNISMVTPNAFDLFRSLEYRIIKLFRNATCLRFYLYNCQVLIHADEPLFTLENVNTIICKYLASNHQLFEQHFASMLPNLRTLKIDNVSIHRIIKNLSFIPINALMFKQIIELHLTSLEIDDDDNNNDYLLQFLQHFSNIKILKQDFVNIIKIQTIQTSLQLLLVNKICSLSII
ncbi:unnamed protein product [Didymodactylos carnosus]|uniref:Uncharacterized protein n=1 Tax=Didymodactylos carnosus TaxID=1234261 RepID=A0A815K9Z9_9BILA|nr:unnamed protein product [Didymodactylos carnosus]CAF4287521.1 unnamed protein product [Didymodactylos carnosus]